MKKVDEKETQDNILNRIHYVVRRTHDIRTSFSVRFADIFRQFVISGSSSEAVTSFEKVFSSLLEKHKGHIKELENEYEKLSSDDFKSKVGSMLYSVDIEFQLLERDFSALVYVLNRASLIVSTEECRNRRGQDE